MRQSMHCRWVGLFLANILIVASATAAERQTKPLKVYIMAGQSNMNGNGAISTFDYMAGRASASTSGHPAPGNSP